MYVGRERDRNVFRVVAMVQCNVCCRILGTQLSISLDSSIHIGAGREGWVGMRNIYILGIIVVPCGTIVY